MSIFWDFPFEQAFAKDEWFSMTAQDRRFIRDYYLCNKDDGDTLMYDFYETNYQMTKMNEKYNLKERPPVHIELRDFCFSGK